MLDPIPPVEAPEAQAEPMMDEIPSLDGLDLPLPAEPAAEAPVEPAADMASLDIDIPDLPDLTAPVAADETPDEPRAEVDPLDFDLSGISLELNPSEAGTSPEASNVIPDLPPDQPGHTVMDLSSTEAEMATKLDLAIAYQEIGDKEGARELLDEVIKGGNPEQSDKARALLMELA
jgi:pilus assembly protein FimV